MIIWSGLVIDWTYESNTWFLAGPEAEVVKKRTEGGGDGGARYWEASIAPGLCRQPGMARIPHHRIANANV